MKIKSLYLSVFFLLMFFSQAYTQDKEWTLQECINYALNKNISIQQARLNEQQQEISFQQSKYDLLPTVGATVSNSNSWNKTYSSSTNSYGELSNNSSMSYGLNGNLTLFNGFRLKTNIEQSELELLSSKYYSESVKESISLKVLDAYLQVLYAREEVKNADEQILSTQEQIKLAEERLKIGIISKSDFLQIKSQLASEKLSKANAQSVLEIARVNLMQIMELPVTKDFKIESPQFEDLLYGEISISVSDIYEQALKEKPEIKEAETNVHSVMLNKKIAKAGAMPSLSMSAGLNTGWSDNNMGFNYFDQLDNQLSPSIGFSLSIPIFEKNQVKTNISLAEISTNMAKLDEINVKNNLRKDIEQAYVDVITATSEYKASIEQYESISESYRLAAEKFELGLINSVDYLIVKKDMITAERNLLQAKYSLVFSNKILDYYKGVPISL